MIAFSARNEAIILFYRVALITLREFVTHFSNYKNAHCSAMFMSARIALE